MPNSVYDPEKQGEQAYPPPRPGSSENQPEGDLTDTTAPEGRGALRKAEGGMSTGSGSSGSFNFNPKGDTGSSGRDNFNFNADGDSKKGGVAAAGLAAELTVGGGAAGAATSVAGRARNFFWGSKRRKQLTVGGGVTGTLIGGAAFTLVILSGPGQLVQLSQILQKNFANMDNASASRSNKLLGTAGAQSLEETRVGVVQRQYFRKTLGRLSDIGIEFKTNAVGQITESTIDTGKLLEKKPELATMTTDERKAWIAREFSLNPESIKLAGGGTFAVDARDFPFKSTRLLIGDSVSQLGKGSISTAIANRTLTKSFGSPSIFHPFKRAQEKALKKLNTKAERRAAVQEDEAKLREPTETKATDAKANIKEKANKYNSIGMKVLLFTGGVCFIKSVAHDIVTVNRFGVVVPSAAQATSFVAQGDQIRAESSATASAGLGGDVSLDQVGAVTDSLTNEQGENIWQGKALQAQSGNRNPGGQDIPPDYKQAFSVDTTASTMEGWANAALGGSLVADAACSPVGLGVQLLGGIALSLGSAWGEIASGGTLTPAIAGVWAAKEGSSFAVSGVAMHFAQKFIVSNTTAGTLAKDAFSGPLGGNLLAYGAREAANIGARSQGAVALAGSASLVMDKQNQQADEHQFRSESFFARTFNVNDYRSLTGKLAQSINPNYTANVATAVHGFGNMGGNLISNLASIFVPQSQAAGSSYNFGFPEYSIPPEVLNDPDLASPVGNADRVAAILDSPGGQSLIDKAKICFGDEVSKESGAWDVKHTEDPNPSDGDFANAHCDNLNDGNWKRMIMFVFDTTTAQAMACYLGDDESCTTLGFNTSAPAADGGGSIAADTTLDMAHLYDSSVDIECAPGTKDLGVQDGYHDGNKVKIRVCAVNSVPETGTLSDVPGANGKLVVNSRLSAFYVNLVKDAEAAGVSGISAQEGFRSMARQTCLYEGRCGPTGAVATPGTSNHQMGLAIDWGDSMIAYLNREPHGLKALVGGEPWHWSPTGN